MTPQCIRCGRPMPDGASACPAETAKAAEQLRNLADMTPAARDIAHGLSRRGAGAATGKPGSRLPLDLTATAKLDGISNTLTGWARHVSETRGVELPEPPVELPDQMIGPLCRTRYECTHDSCKVMRDGDEWGWDMIVLAALFLGEHLEWMRHRPEVDEFLTDVEACARIIAGIARGPSEQRFLGPCGAQVVVEAADGCPVNCACHNGPHYACDEPGGCGSAGCGRARTTDACDGDVYAREGAQHGRCRLCGTEWSTAERRAWLDAEVRSRAFRASEIAEAYGLNVDTIRSWAFDRPDRPARLFAHAHDRDGNPLYLIAHVLDLAAAAVARREEARATRARRTAARAAESESAA